MNLTIWPKRSLVILSQPVPFIMTKPPDIFAYQLFGPGVTATSLVLNQKQKNLLFKSAF